MGHPVLVGALAMVASKMMHSRMQSQQPAQQNQGGGLLGRLF